jgi:hypothetical protein
MVPLFRSKLLSPSSEKDGGSRFIPNIGTDLPSLHITEYRNLYTHSRDNLDLLLLCVDDQVAIAKTRDGLKITTQLVKKVNYDLEISTEKTKSMIFFAVNMR